MGIYNIDMEIGDILEYAALFGIVLFLYNFRQGCTDAVYFALKNWKQSSFIVVCLVAGVGAGLYAANGSGVALNVSMPTFALPLPGDNPGVSQIDSCKDFVEAKTVNRPGYVDPKPSWGDAIFIGAHSYWDTCAQTFGMNYWKQDISINGKNGGQMLCSAYHKDSYRSGLVDSWCRTVLDPQKTTPQVRRASSRKVPTPHAS